MILNFYQTRVRAEEEIVPVEKRTRSISDWFGDPDWESDSLEAFLNGDPPSQPLSSEEIMRFAVAAGAETVFLF